MPFCRTKKSGEPVVWPHAHDACSAGRRPPAGRRGPPPAGRRPPAAAPPSGVCRSMLRHRRSITRSACIPGRRLADNNRAGTASQPRPEIDKRCRAPSRRRCCSYSGDPSMLSNTESTKGFVNFSSAFFAHFCTPCEKPIGAEASPKSGVKARALPSRPFACSTTAATLVSV